MILHDFAGFSRSNEFYKYLALLHRSDLRNSATVRFLEFSSRFANFSNSYVFVLNLINMCRNCTNKLQQSHCVSNSGVLIISGKTRFLASKLVIVTSKKHCMGIIHYFDFTTSSRFLL